MDSSSESRRKIPTTTSRMGGVPMDGNTRRASSRILGLLILQLIGNTVFVRHADLAQNLPPHTEPVQLVPPTKPVKTSRFTQSSCYQRLATSSARPRLARSSSVPSACWAGPFDLEHCSLANRRAVVSIPSEVGLPDGMTVDSDGGLWVAIHGRGNLSVHPGRPARTDRARPSSPGDLPVLTRFGARIC